ncbi:MAG TPA: hypothetical protein VKU90_03665 [Caulobacteraceae bacterium]|nr:hypothetical protein [Caulobacteraceae bacterium]
MSEALVDAFLGGHIDNRAFRHADHLRVGFDLLQRHDFPQAAARLSTGLRAIAARAGAPGAYHETITLAFLALIAERRASGGHRAFEPFARDNPDLADKTILRRWYAPERLGSPLARQTFLLPEPAR